jgi:hypothetical protein
VGLKTYHEIVTFAIVFKDTVQILPPIPFRASELIVRASELMLDG